jgi:hypothetical protein
MRISKAWSTGTKTVKGPDGHIKRKKERKKEEEGIKLLSLLVLISFLLICRFDYSALRGRERESIHPKRKSRSHFPFSFGNISGRALLHKLRRRREKTCLELGFRQTG